MTSDTKTIERILLCAAMLGTVVSVFTAGAWFGLGNVRPRLAGNNSTHGAMVDAVHCTDLNLCQSPGFVQTTYFNHLRIGQLGPSVCRAAGGLSVLETLAASVSVLGKHVAKILSPSPNPKMGGVAAWPIITAMTTIHPARNGAIDYRPRNPMGMDVVSVDGERSVAMNVPPGHPWPTRIGAAASVNLGPKPGDKAGCDTIVSKHRSLLPVGRWGLQPRDRHSILQSNYSMGVV